MYKSEIIKVSVSSTFVSRSRCRKCTTTPSIYFYSRNPISWYDPNRAKSVFEFVKKYCKRLCPEDYKFDDFVYSSKIGYYNHPVNYKGYKPKLHRTRGVNPIFDMVEYLTCECGHTIWAFSEKSVSNRPEISQRKAKYKHNNKFFY